MRVACPLTTEKRLNQRKPNLVYMWQSRVEIERYFVAFSTLPHSKKYRTSVKSRAHIHYVDLHVSDFAYEPHPLQKFCTTAL